MKGTANIKKMKLPEDKSDNKLMRVSLQFSMDDSDDVGDGNDGLLIAEIFFNNWTIP